MATITDFDGLFEALSEVITASENNIHSHLEGLQSSFTGSIEGVSSNFSGLYSFIDSHFSGLSSDFSGVHQHLTQQDETLNTVSESVSNIDLSAIDLTSLTSPSFLTELSLNGRGGSFPDGQKVTILGLDGIFQVEHSVQMLSNNTSLEQLFFYRCSRIDRPEIVIFAPKQLVVLSSL